MIEVEIENGILGGGTKSGMAHQIEINDEIGQREEEGERDNGDPMLFSYSSARFHSPPPTATGIGNEGKCQIKFAVVPSMVWGNLFNKLGW